MSNLKKYLKVYKEDAKHKKAFQQYMMVISENQDFFTRHEVNEFLTDMIKDGTLVYDEGAITDALKKMTTGVVLAAFLATSALGTLTKKDSSIFDKYQNTETSETKKIDKDVRAQLVKYEKDKFGKAKEIDKGEVQKLFDQMHKAQVKDLKAAFDNIKKDVEDNKGDKEVLVKFSDFVKGLKEEVNDLNNAVKKSNDEELKSDLIKLNKLVDSVQNDLN